MQAVGGLTADASAILDIAREEARSYRQSYNMPISLKYLNERVSMYIHAHTLYSAIRPFGCAVIIGSYDPKDGPQMYMIDPAGVSFVCSFCLFIFKCCITCLYQSSPRLDG